MSPNILIVDDETEIADLVALYLENENFHVLKCHTAKEAMHYIKNEKLDLAILDIMLPDMSGLKLCQEIRRRHNYPVIMLTARGEEVDKITGLTTYSDRIFRHRPAISTSVSSGYCFVSLSTF